MKIIEANKFHTPIILEMLRHYRSMSPVTMIKNINDADHIMRLLTHLYAGGGLALLSYKEEIPTGMLLAMIDMNAWDPTLYVLREMAYWVEPDYRGTTCGYRLLKRYVEIGNEMIEKNRIKKYTISKMVNSPDLDYGKLGFRKIEETWTMGE
jgi:hypothetical protein